MQQQQQHQQQQQRRQPRRVVALPLPAVARHAHLLAHLVVVSVAATTVLQSLVSGALTVALPSIADDLGLPADRLQWPMASLSLANGALLLIAGAVADTIAGRRATFLCGLAAFTLSAAATAFVQSGTQLAALCACIGASAAMLSPAGVGILAGCLPDHGQFKSRAFAALGAGQPIGFIVGLLLGGILSTGGHWRVIFWITAAIACAFLVLCILVLPLDGSAIVFRNPPPTTSSSTIPAAAAATAAAADAANEEAESTRHLTSGAATPARLSAGSGRPELHDLERVSSIVSIASESARPPLRQALWHFDWLGALLSTSGLVLLTFALADAEVAPQGWRTPYIPAMLPLSTLALSSFVLWERRLERAAIAKRQRGEPGLTFEPLLPPSIWRAPRFGILLTIVFAAWLSFNCLSYFITVFIQEVQHVSPLSTSLRFLPMVAGGILINILSGWLIPKLRPVWMITLGSSGGCAAAVLFACLNPAAGYWAGGMFFVMILVVATDFAFPVAQLFSVRSAGPRHAALAGSLFATTVRVASSIGLALTSAIATAVARQYAHTHTHTHTHTHADADADADGGLAPDAPEALMRGYRAAGWTCAAFSLCAVLLAFVALRDVGPLRNREEAGPKAAEGVRGGRGGEAAAAAKAADGAKAAADGAAKAADGKGSDGRVGEGSAPAAALLSRVSDLERGGEEGMPVVEGLAGGGGGGVPLPVALVSAISLPAPAPSGSSLPRTDAAFEMQPLPHDSKK